MSKKVLKATLAIGLLITAICSFGGTASAAAGGAIVGLGSKCLDNRNGSTADNNPVQIWTCLTGSTRQLWTWTGDATIRTQNRCLDARFSGTVNDTAAVINTCNGSASQKWALRADSTVVNTNSNLCLNVRNAITTNGNPIVLSTCSTAASQKWNISKAVVALPQTAPTAHASVPAGIKNTPKPIITIVTTGAPEFEPWMQNVIKPLIEQWYPVLGDYYAYPDYAPAKNITITVDPTYNGVAYAPGSSIVLGANYFRNNQSDAGAIIHEATHVVQSNPASGVSNFPGWLIEGSADFARDQLYKDRTPRLATATETYLDGYVPAANLLEFARARSTTPNFIRTLNVAAWRGQYNDNLFKQHTGSSIAQLWTGLTGQTITSFGAISNGMSGKCLDLPNYSTTDGTRIQIQTCNSSDAEKWIFIGLNGSATSGVIKGYGYKCLDVAGAGTTDGNAVWYYSCNYSDAQLWTRQSNGSLLNRNANKCLQPVNQVDNNGTQLEIRSCDGSAAQSWTLPSNL